MMLCAVCGNELLEIEKMGKDLPDLLKPFEGRLNPCNELTFSLQTVNAEAVKGAFASNGEQSASASSCDCGAGSGSSGRRCLPSKNQALIMGGAFVDTTFILDEMPVRGGDSYARVEKIRVGGCAWNVAHVLRILGQRPGVLIPVGDGPNSELVSARVRKDGYDESSMVIVRDSTYDCAQCMCFVDREGERTFIAVPGIENHMKSSWLQRIDFTGHKVIYLCGFDLCGDNAMVYAQELANRMDMDALLFIDAGARVNHIGKEGFDLLMSLKPMLHLNLMELEMMSGTKDIAAGLDYLESLTSRPVVLTLDRYGAMASWKGKFYYFPVTPAPVVDATGAGDCHSAGIISRLMHGENLASAIVFGNQLGGLSIGQYGARLHLPDHFGM